MLQLTQWAHHSKIPKEIHTINYSLWFMYLHSTEKTLQAHRCNRQGSTNIKDLSRIEEDSISWRQSAPKANLQWQNDEITKMMKQFNLNSIKSNLIFHIETKYTNLSHFIVRSVEVRRWSLQGLTQVPQQMEKTPSRNNLHPNTKTQCRPLSIHAI